MQSQEPTSAPPGAAADEYGVTWGARQAFVGLLVVLAALLLAGIPIPLLVNGDVDTRQEHLTVLASDFGGRVLMVIIVFALAGGRDGSWWRLGFRWPSYMSLQRVGAYAGLGLIGAWIIIGVYQGVVAISGVEDLEPAGQVDAMVFDDALLTALYGISLVGVAPITEELLFRGFLFAGFRHTLGLWPAAVVTGALFGAAHLQIGLVVPFALIGVLLALAYQRSRTLWPPYAIHAMFNAISFLGLLLVPEAR